MKYLKTASVVAIACFVCILWSMNAREVLAAKRAPFPSPTALQPIPTTVKPNISGNVNSSPQPVRTSDTPSSSSNPSSSPTDQSTSQAAGGTNSHGLIFKILIGLLVVVILTVGAFIVFFL